MFTEFLREMNFTFLSLFRTSRDHSGWFLLLFIFNLKSNSLTHSLDHSTAAPMFCNTPPLIKNFWCGKMGLNEQKNVAYKYLFIYLRLCEWASFHFYFFQIRQHCPIHTSTSNDIKSTQIITIIRRREKLFCVFHSIHFISSQFELGDLPRHTLGFWWIWPGWWRYTHKNEEQESKNRKAVARLPLYLFVENKIGSLHPILASINLHQERSLYSNHSFIQFHSTKNRKIFSRTVSAVWISALFFVRFSYFYALWWALVVSRWYYLVLGINY